LFTIGVYRWGLIFSGRVPIKDFPANAAGGAVWYQRATRAHRFGFFFVQFVCSMWMIGMIVVAQMRVA